MMDFIFRFSNIKNNFLKWGAINLKKEEYEMTKNILNDSYDFQNHEIEIAFLVRKNNLKMSDLKKVVEEIGDVFEKNNIEYRLK